MQTELIVIGGGPAGMSAAVAAAEAGMRVALVDAGSALGGQYFRHSKSAPDVKRPHDWDVYRNLRNRITLMQRSGQLTYLSRTMVWSVSEADGLFTIRGRKGERQPAAIELHAPRLVIATGAHDRVIPFSGWEQPGSVSLGAAQAMLKSSATLVGKKIVVGGTGPFLLAVASDLVKAGATVLAVVENASFAALATDPKAVWLGRKKANLVINYLATLKRNGVKLLDHSRVKSFSNAENESQVEIQTRKGIEKFVCDVVATGWGFVPQLEIPTALGLKLELDESGNACVSADEHCASSNPRVWVAGESRGIAGVDAAIAEGEVAGVSAARSAGKTTHYASAAMRVSAQTRAFAARLHQAHPLPTGWASELEDQTVVCRCEEVTAGDLRTASENLGAADARSAKLFTRAGMGWCQGRICAQNCSEILAKVTGIEADPISNAASSKRPIANPVPLGLVADWFKQ